MSAMQINVCVCVRLCLPARVFVCNTFKGVVMIGSVGSVFLGAGCIFCIYLQLLIHQHLFNCTEWEQCVQN